MAMADLLNLSPVLAPSTVNSNERLADKLARIAAETKAAQEQRNSTGGLTNVSETQPQAPLPAGVAAPAPEQAQPLPVGVASPESLGSALGATSKGRPPLPAPPPVMGATPGFAQQLAPPQPSPVAMPEAPPAPEEPAMAPPAKPETAREQAIREVGPRTKMNKLGIALSAAAETIGGLPAAGGANRGATARAMGMHDAKIDKRTDEIQQEKDRLQGEIDKGIERARGERAEGRQDTQIKIQLEDLQERIRNNKDKGEIQRLQIEARALKDKSNEDYKYAVLEQKKKDAAAKGVTLQPGATYNVKNPDTGEWVTVIENSNQMVTSTDTTNTEVVKGPDGKEYRKTDSTNTVQTKGPAGSKPKGASGPPSEGVREHYKGWIDSLTPDEAKKKAEELKRDGIGVLNRAEAAAILRRAGLN